MSRIQLDGKIEYLFYRFDIFNEEKIKKKKYGVDCTDLGGRGDGIRTFKIDRYVSY